MVVALIFRLNNDFNTSYVTVQQFFTPIKHRRRYTFQYILCYGSTLELEIIQQSGSNFNTSYVTVQRFFWKLKLQKVKISIHPMLRFNGKKIKQHGRRNRFQYILCYGSTLILPHVVIKNGYFNTSYVTVQHFVSVLAGIRQTTFQYILCYGSTSCIIRFRYFSIISIHPMLRFNVKSIKEKYFKILISIHPMLRFNNYGGCLMSNREEFQYILCYGSTFTPFCNVLK